MIKCGLAQKLLLAYIYGLLDIKEKKEIEAHIDGCPDCAKKLGQLKKMQLDLSNEPAIFAQREKAPNDLAAILAKAKRIENEKSRGTTWIGSMVRMFLDSNAVKMAVAGALAAAVIFVVALWFAFGDSDYLYMTRAYGDVKVNDKPLFVAKNFIYRMEVNRPVKIGVGLGECQFQVNRNKYFELKPLTRVLVERSKDIIINFLEGMLIGKVIKDDHARDLQILTPYQNAIFRIVGTLFYVRSTNQAIEFGVKEGEVRNVISNRSFTIRDSEIMRVGPDYVEHLTNTVEQKLRIDSIFDKLGQYLIRKDFSDTREIVIRTEPSDSEIYWKDKPIGRSPLYILGNRDQFKELTIVKKGYLPKQIELGMKKFYDVTIRREQQPETIWNLGRKDTRFVNPVLLDDGGLLLGDESGWVYKLDTVKKSVLWKFQASLRNNSVPLAVSNKVFFSSSDGYLYAVGSADGKLAWKQKVGILVYSGPQYHEGLIYTCNIEGTITAMDPSDGRTVWKKKFEDGFYTSPLLSENVIYIGSMRGVEYALNAQNGEVLWQFQTGDRIVSSRPIIKDHKLYFGSNDKNFYCLDSRTGKPIWRYDTGGEIFTSPLQMGASLLICTVKGDILSLDMNQGELLWKYSTGKKILLNPVLVRGGYLFISSEKNLYILNRYGILFVKAPFDHEIADFTVSEQKDVYICGGNGDLKDVRFTLD
jgi:outer membrane protein assembly factor BamB